MRRRDFIASIAGAAAAYLLSPIQVIPSFIPFIGLMDDLVVLSVGMGLIRILTPRSVIHEARRRALVDLGQGENILPSAVRKITLAFALSWLVLSLGLFLILWRK